MLLVPKQVEYMTVFIHAPLVEEKNLNVGILKLNRSGLGLKILAVTLWDDKSAKEFLWK